MYFFYSKIQQQTLYSSLFLTLSILSKYFYVCTHKHTHTKTVEQKRERDIKIIKMRSINVYVDSIMIGSIKKFSFLLPMVCFSKVFISPFKNNLIIPHQMRLWIGEKKSEIEREGRGGLHINSFYFTFLEIEFADSEITGRK